MGNLLPNISPDSIMADKNRKDSTSTAKTESGYDAKNYLNVRLEQGEESKKITIRLLPMDLETGNPFVHVHFHNVKVPKEVSASGYKSYLCLSKNQDINHEKFGTKCPFCECNSAAYKESLETDDPTKKKALQDLSIANKAKPAVIVRCIERGKEDEGVKFWKFNVRNDGTDPYNQMLKLYELRKEEGAADGIETNIFDLNNGVDLTVTITPGNSAPTIVDGRVQKPLSKDEKQMEAWIYDEKKWQDVFTPKPYDYLELIAQMKTPWYDRETKTWIDKEEYLGNHTASVSEIDNSIEKSEAMLKGEKSDEQKKNELLDSMMIREDELPF